MLIAFDFDGTIAKSTTYHRQGWESVLRELNLSKPLDELLPYEPNLKERFDSYRRIKKGFLESDSQINYQISSYFAEKDIDTLTQKIMNLKESSTIKSILNANTYELVSISAVNLASALIDLKDKGHRIAIISSTRRTIISAFLAKTSVLDLFDYIVGEEDLYENGKLKDKPDSFAAKKVETLSKSKMKHYIGDNDLIDREFASNSDSNFILADYSCNMLEIIKNIYE